MLTKIKANYKAYQPSGEFIEGTISSRSGWLAGWRAARAVTSADLRFGKHVLLRKGKKNYVVVTAK